MAAPFIVLVDDDPAILELQKITLESAGLETQGFTDPLEAWEHIRNRRTNLVVADWEMPSMSGMDLLFRTKGLARPPEVILLTGYGSVDRAVEAMRGGAVSFIEKPFDPKKYIESIKKALSRASGELPAVKPSDNIAARPVFGAPRAREAYAKALAAASMDSTILVLGESGVGKEVLADYIHQNSARAKGPIVKVNCGALPEHLMESELFGHEKGAFTGADRRRVGRFEEASGGTLFLDEIGDLLLPLQVKLLRAIQERTIERVGSSTSVPVDIRLVCATHRDLKQAVKEGSFREDLYYRINVIPIHLPALRERAEDIPQLAQHFLAQLSSKAVRKVQGFSREALDCLLRFPWPGNIRQLRNAIEYAVVLSQHDVITPADLPDEVRGEAPAVATAAPVAVEIELSASKTLEASASASEVSGEGSLDERLKAVESRILLDVLGREGWNINAAAKSLGISRSALYEKMKAYNIKRPEA